MYQSRCFRGSAGRLGCISCHDPHVHVGPDERVAYFRDRCLKCHQDRGCSLPAEERRPRGDSCIDCHMPPYGSSDVAHTAATDHRVPRRPGPAAAARPGRPPGGGAWFGLPVRPFQGEGKRPNDPEVGRDLGIALVMLNLQGKAPPGAFSNQAVALLDAALRDDPADLEAGEARGHALTLQNRRAQALAAFEAVLDRAPDREAALAGAAQLAMDLQKHDLSLAYWRRAVAINPSLPDYRARLVALLVRKQAWDEVRAHCPTWIGLDPENAEARMVWINCLLRAGDRDAAREEFARVEALRPPGLDKFRAWFAEQMR
jgi:tetratricopeptide (TPR) repeat protein